MRARDVLIAALVVLVADAVVLLTGAADRGPDAVVTAPTGTASTTAPVVTTAPLDPGAATVATGAAATEGAPADPPTSSPPAPSGPVMPAPGHYTQTVSGTAMGGPVQGQPSFVIEQVNDTDQRQVTETPQGSTVQVLRYREAEVLLVSMDLAGFKQFQPAPPVRFLPVPLVVGEAWSWRVTSTDGLTTLDQASRISTTEGLVIGGVAVETVVVETTLTLSGDANGTILLTSWVSPAHALAVRTHQVTDVSYGVLIRLQSDTVAELTSLTPS